MYQMAKTLIIAASTGMGLSFNCQRFWAMSLHFSPAHVELQNPTLWSSPVFAYFNRILILSVAGAAMYEHAMRLGQEVSGLDSLQKQVEFDRDNKIQYAHF